MSALVKPITRTLGVVLILAGIISFVAPQYMFGVSVDTMTSVVHIVLGVVGLIAGNTYAYARLFLIVIGLLLGIVGVTALVTGGDVFGLASMNQEGGILHVVIAAVCLLFGFGSGKAN
jgi:hypothetical protein